MKDAQNSGLRPEYKTYDCQKCFVAHSHDAQWSEDIQAACREVLPECGSLPALPLGEEFYFKLN